LSERLGATAIVKHENHTPIGAFKVRGGLVYVERMKRERSHVTGLISATRGNHGPEPRFRREPLRCAGDNFRAARQFGWRRTAAMRAFGATLVRARRRFSVGPRGGRASRPPRMGWNSYRPSIPIC